MRIRGYPGSLNRHVPNPPRSDRAGETRRTSTHWSIRAPKHQSDQISDANYRPAKCHVREAHDTKIIIILVIPIQAATQAQLSAYRHDARSNLVLRVT